MASAPPVGSILGERYVLIGRVTEAPGYTEYRSRDREVEVEVAVWWLHPTLFADPARQDAVLGAGVELRALNDPALRTCLGVGRGTGGLWATWQMATAPGPCGVAAPGTRPTAPPALDDLRRWVDAACAGVAALHREGLVHGRLTPVDLISVGGVLKLGGGGLWRDADPRAAAAVWANEVHGVAPEVRRGEPATPAADVWSIASYALALIAGVRGDTPDCARMAARRHPALAALLVGALDADPGRRPDPDAFAEAARNAAAQAYQVEARGKPAAAGGAGATLQGHATPAAETPRRTAARPVAMPEPSAQPAPGAYAPEPASFALPTPAVAPPPPPRPSKPMVAVQPAPARRPTTVPPPIPPRRTGTTRPPASPPAETAPAPAAVLPTPHRAAIAGAIDRARTAPPGEFRVAAVSLKPGGASERPTGMTAIVDGQPDQPTGETPHLMKPRMRGIAESAKGGRSFSVTPGQLGYLAPPKAVSDARNRDQRRWWLLLLVLALIAIGSGVTIGLLL